ncbi:MAG TPA: baseplate J/gp47 family protein [Candidatus Limnocylindrales bacterium]
MAAIVYLDVDDEITSAAARIRSSGETRIALVVPYGSRLGTSRINFRLLAREAQSHGRTLSIVAADAATRALAGSAGLDTFGAVNEYERTGSGDPGRPTAAPTGTSAPGGNTSVSVARPRQRRARQDSPIAEPRSEAHHGLFDDLDTAPTVVMPVPTARLPTPASAAPGAASAVPATTRPPSLPVVRGLPRRIALERTPLAIGAAVVAIALLVVGVGGFLLLPTATIRITPRLDAAGPLAFTITADPAATEPDAERAIIPAQELRFDLQASGDFAATGKRVEADPATGEVTFSNYDFTARNNVPAGSIVSTEGGIAFRTTADVSVPAGTFILPEVVPGKATIGIEAVRPGPAGNVPANAITVVPSRENPQYLKVRNGNPTAGGARREFKRVVQADLDAALLALEGQLHDQLDAILADPATVPDGLTLFPDTRQLAEAVPTTDPAAVLGQEMETFPLAVTAVATVVALDEAPVNAVAGARLQETVATDHRLLEDSVVVDAGDPTVTDGQVRIPVTVRGSQVLVIDPARVLNEVKGKPVAEARSHLESYGQVDIATWPDWVGAIPTLDLRLDLRVEEPVAPS